jgi:uncharacterized membrane protein
MGAEARRVGAAIRAGPSWQFALLLFGCAIFVVVLSWVQYVDYQAFESVPSDLGSYNQAFFTTLHGGGFFYYTTNIPGGNGGDLFGTHFVPFFLLLLPVYALAPGPLTLVVLKYLGLAAGAIPLYGIARIRLASRNWALLSSTVYLVTPFITSLDWNGFDPEVFLPVTVLTAYYFLLRQQTLYFAVSWLLALSVIETIAPLLVAFAFFGLVIDWWVRRAQPYLPLRGERPLLLLGLGLALVWMALSYWAITHLNPVGATYGSSYGSRYSVLGANSFPQVFPQALLHPDLAWAALNYQGGTKATYLALAVASFGFMPLLGEKRALLAAGTWAGFAVLSNSGGFYALGTQYVAYLVPFLLIGMVSGLVVARRWASRLSTSPTSEDDRSLGDELAVRRRKLVRSGISFGPALVLVVCLAATTAASNPFLASPLAGTPFNTFGIAAGGSHEVAVRELLALLPSSAAVFATLHTFPQISSRADAYSLSDGSGFSGTTTFWGWLQHDINVSQFVFLDFVVDPENSAFVAYYGNLSGFGLVGAADGAYLYERGWTGAPILWSPRLYQFAGSDLNLADAVASTKFGTALGGTLFHAADHRPGATVWSGPREPTLPPGDYRMTLWMRMLAPTAGNELRLAANLFPLKITAYVTDSTPYNHHYHFDESTNDLPPINLGRWNVSSANGSTGWVESNVSMDFSFDEPGTFNEGASELAGDMALYLVSLTLEQLPPG